MNIFNIEEKFTRVYESGQSIPAGVKRLPNLPKDAKFKDISVGWYVQLEGSNESFFISEKEPDLKVGDKVKITLERATT